MGAAVWFVIGASWMLVVLGAARVCGVNRLSEDD